MKILGYSMFFLSQLVLSACASINATNRQDAYDRVRASASFDLGCPGEQLTFRTLAEACMLGECVPVEVGVTGCDNRARYMRIGDKWVANIATTD